MFSPASRSFAIQNLFLLFESKFGNLPSLIANDCTRVISRDAASLSSSSSSSSSSPSSLITHDDLTDLFTHKAIAIHYKGFYPKNYSKELGMHYETLAEQGAAKNWKVSTAKGLESSDVSTIGTPSNMSLLSKNEYFGEALKRFGSNREINLMADLMIEDDKTPPLLHPLDKLRLELDEAWSYGANVGRSKSDVERRPYNAGLPRIMYGPTRWRKGFMHVDDLSPMSTSSGTFSANVYLQLPRVSDNFNSDSDGGMLQIWPLKYSKLDFYRNASTLSGLTSQDSTMQMNLRQKLGAPIILNVEEGDLVMLCVQRPHAVVGFEKGCRVSLQTFLEFGGTEKHLTVDS